MPKRDYDLAEAQAAVAGSPELEGPHVVADQADALFDAIVPEHPYELDYLAGRIALSLEETKLALGIGDRTMRTALARGEIPSVYLGGRRLVPVRALERHLEAMAFAASGSLDAWEAALISGARNRLAVSRRRAVEKRRYAQRRLKEAHKRLVKGGAVDRDRLASLKDELLKLRRERAVTENFARDMEAELEHLERRYAEAQGS